MRSNATNLLVEFENIDEVVFHGSELMDEDRLAAVCVEEKLQVSPLAEVNNPHGE